MKWIGESLMTAHTGTPMRLSGLVSEFDIMWSLVVIPCWSQFGWNWILEFQVRNGILKFIGS